MNLSTENRRLKNLLVKIEQENRRLKELRNIGCIYQIKYEGQVVYVGKDSTSTQKRRQNHISQARQIRQAYQQIDIFLATTDESKIEFEYIQSQQIAQDEQQLITELQPKFNVIQTNRILKCNQCQKQYSSLMPFQKHVTRCGIQETDQTGNQSE